MKTVAIIGAGPAGLVTAKTLLARSGAFTVAVFEKKPLLGGIWALDHASTTDGFLSASTPTNLSQFQVAFSDLAWDSVDCATSSTCASSAQSTRSAAPIFPKAWQAGQYLRAYAQRYIPPGVIRCDHAVKSTQRVQQGSGFVWKVTVDGPSSRHTSTFDHLVIASGFFSQPRVPTKDLDPFRGTASSPPVRTIHTSQFRSLADLFPTSSTPAGKKVLIFGGGNSVGETAGSIAFALSSERYSSSAGAKRVQDCSIVLVTPHRLYALPPYVPADEHNSGFVPIDLRFYDLASRPPAEIVSKAGRLTQEVIDFIHSGARKFVGGDQSELGAEALAINNGYEKRTLQASLTENFAEFVRSGDVAPVAGRVVRIEPAAANSDTVRALVKAGDQEIWIDNIGAVVHATGYTPYEALAFLPDSIKETLGYDSGSTRLPLLLDEMQTINHAIPELGFVGFYEGPYWGMLEMQARLLAQRWLGIVKTIDRPSESKEQLLQLRKGMMDRDADVPQYWMGDFLGHMEHFSRDLKLQRNDQPFGAPRHGPLLPARFVDQFTDKVEADKAMQKAHATLEASKHGVFVARAAIRALQGKWSLHRRIQSMTPDFPSGVFEGIAYFHPRVPTPKDGELPFDFELLYLEKGAFIAENGLTFQASRRYVYRYYEADDCMSVWFVKDDEYTVDYLFHNLTFSPPPGTKANSAYSAKAEHLCVADLYKTGYEFDFNGVNLRTFRTIHNVKGPKKDYNSYSEYERP